MLSALTDEERVHYEWLIRGLLAGARRLAGVPGAEETLARTLQTLEDLFLDVIFLASVTPRNIDGEARRLERSLIEELLQEAADNPGANADGVRADGSASFAEASRDARTDPLRSSSR